MRLEPEANASATSQKPNSSLDQSTISAPSCERWVAQVAAAREVVEHEVAVRDGVERVLGDARRSRAPAATNVAVGVEVHARRARPAPSGRSSVARRREVEALAVAAELPEVGEQVVREVDGLGALEVRVAGQRPVEVALGERRAARAISAAQQLLRAAAAWARTNSATSVATWSLRERPVWSLPPTGPTISVSRRSIAMWMSSSSGRDLERVLVDLAADRVEAALDLGQVLVAR